MTLIYMILLKDVPMPSYRRERISLNLANFHFCLNVVIKVIFTDTNLLMKKKCGQSL